MSRPGCDIDARTLLADLTEPQRQAVTHTDGPLLVLAGAGSGKTRVITRRAAYVAATVARPYQVLAITFTNKAANEMRERIVRLGVGPDMTVCTFHSICARLLRIHHDRADLPGNFTIFDQADQRAVVKQALHRCELDKRNWPVWRVLSRISQAKNAMQTPEEFAQQAHYWQDRTLARIYTAYEQILAEQAGLDFDDLLLRLAVLLDRDQELRDRLEDRYRYLLIDEYQDTNDAQYRIAHLLTQRRRNLCVTGDPDQSIYAWRGANITNILRFEKDHPDALVVRLEQNYHSTKRILSAASSLISFNINRKEKTLWTENDEGRSVRTVDCPDATVEANLIAGEIATAVANGREPRDVAVCYRINALSLEIELALQRAGIAYQVARGQEFYGRKEIKDLIAYLRVLVNPADATSLRRIINTPARGIGKTTVAKLDALAESSNAALHDVVMNPTTPKELGRSGSKVADFADLLRSLTPLVDAPAAKALSEVFSRTGLRASLLDHQVVDADPCENVENLIVEARRYDQAEPDGSLLGWLEQVSLVSDIDSLDDTTGAVTLLTLHAAKGLEFPVIYIVGLEDGLLPFRRDEETPSDEEEERRLCFVGMTRAKEELTLTHARFRIRHGRELRTMRSPFLDELPREELEWINAQEDDAAGGGRSRRQGGARSTDFARWRPGTHVHHDEHGIGKIVSIYRGSGQTHAAIQFESGDQQTFILEYADKLTYLEPDEVG